MKNYSKYIDVIPYVSNTFATRNPHTTHGPVRGKHDSCSRIRIYIRFPDHFSDIDTCTPSVRFDMHFSVAVWFALVLNNFDFVAEKCR